MSREVALVPFSCPGAGAAIDKVSRVNNGSGSRALMVPMNPSAGVGKQLRPNLSPSCDLLVTVAVI
jgi:hypothetical protein